MNTVEQITGYTGRFTYGDDMKRHEQAGDASFSTLLGDEYDRAKSDKSDLHHSGKNDSILSIVNDDVKLYNIWGHTNSLKLSAGLTVNKLV
jgi:hypothetical protein